MQNYGLILRKPQDPTGQQIHIFTFLNLHVCNVLYFIFVTPGLVIASSECFTRLIFSLSDLIYSVSFIYSALQQYQSCFTEIIGNERERDDFVFRL